MIVSKRLLFIQEAPPLTLKINKAAKGIQLVAIVSIGSRELLKNNTEIIHGVVLKLRV